MANLRCKYRLSDKLVLGATVEADAGAYDDANHGTTIEFDMETVPKYGEYTYDDTPSSEALNANPDYGASLSLSLSISDTDSDGIADLAADDVATATITIQKKDKNGTDMVAAGDNDSFLVQLSTGAADIASGSLVNGTATVVIQASTAKGCVVEILIKSTDAVLARGQTRVKFR